jgi:hypothetical protein
MSCSRVVKTSPLIADILDYPSPKKNRLLHRKRKLWVPHCPDFLRRLVALIHFMRLSLMKGAHADLSSAAWQEIGVKPFFGLSGLRCPRLAVLLNHRFRMSTVFCPGAVIQADLLCPCDFEAQRNDSRGNAGTARSGDGLF